MTTITYTITRDDDEIDLEITETSRSFDVVPSMTLTQEEMIDIEYKLEAARADEWDEDGWKAGRES